MSTASSRRRPSTAGRWRSGSVRCSACDAARCSRCDGTTSTSRPSRCGSTRASSPPNEGAAWSNAKNERSRRVIPLDDDTVRALTRRRAEQAAERLAAGSEWEDNDLIIATRTGRLVLPRSYDRALATIVDNAGLPRLTSHGLRHTAATHMVQGATRRRRAPSDRRSARPQPRDADEHLRPRPPTEPDCGGRSDQSANHLTGSPAISRGRASRRSLGGRFGWPARHA